VTGRPSKSLTRALALLGPLERRIMRIVWSGSISDTFAVRDVQSHMRELAYTTIMTTLNRLAEKGILTARAVPGQRAYAYRAACSPEQYLAMAGRQAALHLVRRYGDAALAAFSASLEELTSEERRRLRELAGQ
jgi:predicted transcriptional regulator